MQLVLHRIARCHSRIKVIVTSDRRGDTIERMLHQFGAEAIRLPDGLRMRPFFKELKQESRVQGEILAAALDGPLGPRHEPKKLLFLLASEAGKEMVSVHFRYRRVIRLKSRWDRYVIPLPFCRITASFEELGIMKAEDLRNFEEYQKRLVY